ncbi:MAG TPA: Rieske 2Fe-2S domain-containing protein [Acidimicrobiales bacterium]|nr:Rieske 2Fe-2S domain-containing protein [Acidimicrobiales bacterium]
MSDAPLGEGRHDRRDELVVSASFLVAAAAAIGLAVVYWSGGQPHLEGLLLAAGAGGLAVGLITWAHRLLPQGPEVEDREVFAKPEPSSDETALEADLGRGGAITRRKVILRSLGASAAAFGIALLFPLRSLGPRPTGAELDDTPWGPGKRLVNEDGSPVMLGDVPLGGLVTVFPDGAVNSEVGQAVLVRVDPSLIRPLPGREGWTPDGLIAYSKVCPHAGCPVGLYEAASHQLLCPCHQSTFDVLDGAKPIFGPAAAPLPQLPLTIGDDGIVRASGGFNEPPGPSFWNRRQ